MKKLILSLAILLAAHSISYGGLLDRSVDFADLAKLSEEGLQAPKDTEFEVFLANVSLAKAKATEDLARERLKAAEENLDKERLNLKAVMETDSDPEVQGTAPGVVESSDHPPADGGGHSNGTTYVRYR